MQFPNKFKHCFKIDKYYFNKYIKLKSLFTLIISPEFSTKHEEER